MYNRGFEAHNYNICGGNCEIPDTSACVYWINEDVYVSPTEGDNVYNNESGIKDETPFRTIGWALYRINPSEQNPITIYLDEGISSEVSIKKSSHENF